MDDEDAFFDRLDMLGRHQQQQVYDPYQNESSAGYAAYDGYLQQHHAYDNAYSADYVPQDEFVQEPMQLDAFDERLLQQPDLDSRHGQAALGRARLSLPPARGGVAQPRGLYQSTALNPPLPSQRPELSRFAFEPGHAAHSTSSSLRQSSPTYRLSQQQSAPASQFQESGFDAIHGGSAHHASFQPTANQAPESDEQVLPSDPFEPHPPSRPKNAARASQAVTTGAPIVQGISLVSTHELPDRFRAIFPFPLFNAVQSKCFSVVYQTNDNFVVSAPTGSGKTAVLELAICRMINGFSNGSSKVVYQAPTKSLCAERQRDWQAKFGPLDMQCVELTGDTDQAQLRNVQHASIIVTTPEKWDSITRKWKDHQKLMQTVKLFLIDEVHILKEDRGATLEAVVSRMKSVGSNVRFVALSATVPNSQDIATWLGKDSTTEQVPAPREKFGEEFRPVRLQKHVCGYHSNANDYVFEHTLNAKLTDVVAKWSQRKPIMVFCMTRKSCIDTAKLLANWWSTKGPKDRYWPAPRQRIAVVDTQLKETVTAGVAFHHAGLSLDDRTAVEKAYLRGDLSVICCTSTLAVGVNLPCHMVIIKNTVTYNGSGTKEYSDLEIMQMLGRAGRPQFDNSAVAVIMTRLQRVNFYEQMISGQELLESCLHNNITEHLNSEIGLGTVTSLSTAKKWLKGTFLYVRLKENPEHYHIEDQAPGRDLDERLENICKTGLASLEEHDLVRGTTKLQSTEFGDAMARYYIKFDTMKNLLALPQQAKVSEILSTIAQAAEFRDIRFRAGEKVIYRDLNKNSCIKFKIPVNIDSTAHKVSLVIQSTLGVIDLPTDDFKHQNEYVTAKNTIFQHAHRITRCIIDCQLYLEDSVSARNALMLARSFGAQVWDDSPLQLMQLESLGVVYARKISSGNIKSIEELENTDPRRIETLVSRNPPYGSQLQEKARAFPRLRITLKSVDKPIIKKGECVTVKVRADIGFINDKPPEKYGRKMVYVCLLADTSDGRVAHFARISAKKMGKGQEVPFTVDLTAPGQTVRGFVMCDEFAGTQRTAMLTPDVPAFMFPTPKQIEESKKQPPGNVDAPHTTKRRSAAAKDLGRRADEDEFGDAGLDDATLAAAVGGGFTNIDDYDEDGNAKSKSQSNTAGASKTAAPTAEDWQPRQLANGKWACNHKCKQTCKHLCCRDGLDRPPKPPKPKEPKKDKQDNDPKQTKLDTTKMKTKKPETASTEPQTAMNTPRKKPETKQARDLDRIHNSVKNGTSPVRLLKNQPYSNAKAAVPTQPQPRQNSYGATRQVARSASSDYGLDSLDDEDLPMDLDMVGTQQAASRMSPPPTNGNSNEDLLDDLWSYTKEETLDDPFGPTNGNENVDPADDDIMLDSDIPDFAHDQPPPAEPKQRSIFITGNTSSSEFNKANDTLPTSSKHDREAEFDLPDTSTYFPPAKKRKDSLAQDLSDEPLLNDVPAPHSDDTLMQDVAAHAAQSDQMEAQYQDKDDGKSKDVQLREWFEKEFGTDQFELV